MFIVSVTAPLARPNLAHLCAPSPIARALMVQVLRAQTLWHDIFLPERDRAQPLQNTLSVVRICQPEKIE
ncbi:MAG: hypothetical protein K0R45_1077, partial [Pseudomonas sp.]|nr:hypothetical protein [Pseudomonas sp.]